MITFLKANMSSLLASGCDFLLTILLVQFAGWNAVVAAAAGTITGGVINFLINRHWVFQTGDEKAVRQMGKYVLVWVGNLLLNTGGVYVLTSWAGCHYVLAKIITSLLVAFLYNYPMQKNFVFSNNW